MTWKPYSDTPGERVELTCVDTGRPTKMWSLGKTYLAQVAGVRCGLLELLDDRGNIRAVLNEKYPSFPMGTDEGRVRRVYTARFTRFPIDTYYMHDQPFCCPQCGARTEYEEVGAKQLHTCARCARHYWLEEDTFDE